MPSNVYGMLLTVMAVGVLASILGGSIIPLTIAAAVCWSAYHVARRLYG